MPLPVLLSVERPVIPATSQNLKCHYKPTTNDKKLIKGRKSGTFTLASDVTSMGDCMAKCCEQTMCELAYLEKGKCFTVTCYSPDSCKTTMAKDDEESPLMAFTSPIQKPSVKGAQNY